MVYTGMVTLHPALTVAIPALKKEAKIADVLCVLIHQKPHIYNFKEIVDSADAQGTNFIFDKFSSNYPSVRFDSDEFLKVCRCDGLQTSRVDFDLACNYFGRNLAGNILSDKNIDMFAPHNKFLGLARKTAYYEN
jgi:hypothetical protein